MAGETAIRNLNETYRIYSLLEAPRTNGAWMKSTDGSLVMLKGNNISRLSLQGREIMMPGAAPRMGLKEHDGHPELTPPGWYRNIGHMIIGNSNEDEAFALQSQTKLTRAQRTILEEAIAVRDWLRQEVLSASGSKTDLDLLRFNLGHHGVTQCMKGFEYSIVVDGQRNSRLRAQRVIMTDRDQASPLIPFSYFFMADHWLDSRGTFHQLTTIRNLERFSIPTEFMSHPYLMIPGGMQAFNNSRIYSCKQIYPDGVPTTKRTLLYDLADYYKDGRGNETEFPLPGPDDWLELVMPDGSLRISYEGDFNPDTSRLGVFAPFTGPVADTGEKTSYYHSLWQQSAQTINKLAPAINTFKLQGQADTSIVNSFMESNAVICIEPKTGAGATLRTHAGIESAVWLAPHAEAQFLVSYRWQPKA